MGQNVWNFLRENKYIASLTKADKNTYCLLTPSLDLTIYKISDGKKCGVWVTEDGKSDFWSLPPHGVRLIISCDITKRCQAEQYNPRYLFLYDKYTEVKKSSIISFLPEPQIPIEKQKEIDLLEIFEQAYKTNFLPYYGSEARRKGVYLSYHLSELYLKEKK